MPAPKKNGHRERKPVRRNNELTRAKPVLKKIEEVKRILAEHKDELHQKFHVSSIGIFGSYVRGDQTSSSDLDVLVDFDAPMGWEIVDVHEYLEEILGMKVDMATKGAVNRKPLLWKSIEEDLVNV